MIEGVCVCVCHLPLQMLEPLQELIVERTFCKIGGYIRRGLDFYHSSGNQKQLWVVEVVNFCWGYSGQSRGLYILVQVWGDLSVLCALCPVWWEIIERGVIVSEFRDYFRVLCGFFFIYFFFSLAGETMQGMFLSLLSGGCDPGQVFPAFIRL